MTVPNTVNMVQYTGPQTSPVVIPFEVFQAADLVVFLQSAAGVTPVKLTLTTDYTVPAGQLNQLSGSQLAFVSTGAIGSSLASGAILTIFRDPSQVQGTFFAAQGPLAGPSVMATMDLLTMEVQATRRIANNGIQIPLTESLAGLSTTLPTAAARAGGFVGFDINGNVLVSGGPPGTPAGPAGGDLTGSYPNPTVATANGAAVTATGTTTGRTLATRFAEVFNVKDEGAAGNGTTDDTTAIQAALTAAQTAGGGIVWLPPGIYKVSATLTLVGTSNSLQGVIVRGAGSGATKLAPTAALAGLPVFKITDCRRITVQDMWIQGMAATALCAIQFFATGAAPGSTNNRVRDCILGSTATGQMTDGIQWACTGGDGGSGDTDNDDSIIAGVYFMNCVSNGAHIMHSNSLWHRFVDCDFFNVAIGINAETGSFNAVQCSFACTSFDFQLGTYTGTTLYHGSVASNCNSEANVSIAGFYANVGGAAGASLTFVNCERSGSITGTGSFIACASLGGVLTIIGCQLITGQNNAISMTAAGKLIIVGSQIGLKNVTYNGEWISLGNFYLAGAPTDTDGSGASSVFQAGDVNSSNPAVYQGLRGNRVRISGTKTEAAAQNIRGTVAFGATDTTKTVSFAVAEPDTSYFISLAAYLLTGSSNAGSLRASISSKTTSGFTVTIEAAPGTSNSITVDWMLIR